MQTYMIAGLEVASEIELPMASPKMPAGGGRADVTIRFGEMPHANGKAVTPDSWLEKTDDGIAFRPKSGLSFLIRDGRQIIISRSDEIADDDVHLFLVGSVWGVLCHQRHLLPLHCSAVACDGQAVAFTGDSGAGKSTLAAGLSQLGYAHVCDDVSVIEASESATRLMPMPKGLKLWCDAAEALGIQTGPAVSEVEQLGKFYVSVPSYGEADPLPLKVLYLLTEEAQREPTIEALEGSRRFEVLYSSVYRNEWLGLMRDPAEIFRYVTELATKIRVFQFARPRDLSKFDDGLKVLEAHMRAVRAP